jgi:hypothetical protein
LVVDDELGTRPVRWLGQPPRSASSEAMLAETDNLMFLRGLPVGSWGVGVFRPKWVTAVVR